MSTAKTGLSAKQPSKQKAAISMADTELPVRINVELPPAARAKLKMHALKKGKTISDLIRAYIDKLPD